MICKTILLFGNKKNFMVKTKDTMYKINDNNVLTTRDKDLQNKR